MSQETGHPGAHLVEGKVFLKQSNYTLYFFSFFVGKTSNTNTLFYFKFYVHLMACSCVKEGSIISKFIQILLRLFYFETGSCYTVQDDLKLVMPPSQLPCSGTTGIHDHVWLSNAFKIDFQNSQWIAQLKTHKTLTVNCIISNSYI